MKKQRTLLALVLAVLMTVSLLAGCGGSAAPAQQAAPAATEAPAEQPAAEQPAAAEAPAAEAAARTVTDVFGREVEIPAEVKTCAALGSLRVITQKNAQTPYMMATTPMSECFMARPK